MTASMIGTGSSAATADVGTASGRQTISLDDLAPRESGLISRLPLALVLAVISVLVPGEASRFLEAPLDWTELSPLRWRSLTRMRAVAEVRSQPGAAPIGAGVA